MAESAKADGLVTDHYLRYIFTVLPMGSTVEQIGSLMPLKIPAEQPGRLRLNPIALNEESPGGRKEPPGF